MIFEKKDEPAIIAAEIDGLHALSDIPGVNIPQIHHIDKQKGIIHLERMDGYATSQTFALLGEMMARLHESKSNRFGWNQDNFIGRLKQSNNWTESWPQFWVGERLMPQFELARERGLMTSSVIPERERLLRSVDRVAKDRQPCLIHGDFWNGNFVVDLQGNPFLIDPSVYVGVGSVDIAMSLLFGGFGDAFYDHYEKNRGALPSKEEVNLYQLYYLLVHINMFGKAYEGQVRDRMQRLELND